MRKEITRHEGRPYAGQRGTEERRDVFTAEVDYGASVYAEASRGIREPVFTIHGSGEHRRDGRYGDARDEEWRWAVGTGLRVARSSIPALLAVLADLMEHEVEV